MYYNIIHHIFELLLFGLRTTYYPRGVVIGYKPSNSFRPYFVFYFAKVKPTEYHSMVILWGSTPFLSAIVVWNPPTSVNRVRGMEWCGDSVPSCVLLVWVTHTTDSCLVCEGFRSVFLVMSVVSSTMAFYYTTTVLKVTFPSIHFFIFSGEEETSTSRADGLKITK